MKSVTGSKFIEICSGSKCTRSLNIRTIPNKLNHHIVQFYVYVIYKTQKSQDGDVYFCFQRFRNIHYKVCHKMMLCPCYLRYNMGNYNTERDVFLLGIT